MRHTTLGKRTLRDRSKYDPHQSTREQMRRIRQIIRGQIHAATALTEEQKIRYVEYAIAKAAGQDLSRFKVQPAVEYAKLDDVFSGPTYGDDIDGLMDVFVIPEEGQN